MKESNSSSNKNTVKLFGIASFLNDLGSDILYPIWPAFVTQYLYANMTILGFIDGLGEAIVSISQAISGFLSDKYRKRKIFIWMGYLLGAISRIGYALSKTYQPVIFFKALDRFGKIRSAPRDAVIADLSTYQNRGKNFGFLRSMDNLGALVGIVLSFLLFPILGYQKLFLLAAFPSLIGAGLILMFFKEEKVQTKTFAGYSLKNLDINLKILFFVSLMFSLGNFTYSFLLVFANKNGFPIYSLPLLYLIFTVVATFFSYYFGKLADKFGRKLILAFSFLLWIFTLSVLILFPYFVGFIVSFILYGFHKASFDTVHKTFIADLSPQERRASIIGGFQMFMGIMAFPASFIAGVLWESFNIFAPFYISIVITIISLILLSIVKENNRGLE